MISAWRLGALAITISLATPFTGFSQEQQFKLIYQNANKWVAQDDKASLVALMDTAEKNNVNYFQVSLPAKRRSLNIKRLEILRNILVERLERGIIMEETQENTQGNSILFLFLIIPKTPLYI